MLALTALRFAIMYETPEGTRRLSSSTRNPSFVRTRSVPQMATQVPCGGVKPRISTLYCGQPRTTSTGTTPSSTMRPSP